MSGITVNDHSSAQTAASWIIRKGTANVIITLGEKDCFYQNAKGEAAAIPAFRVKQVDTAAAGDTFLGAYAAACADGMQAQQALTFAASAAALAVTTAGAQSSIPSRAEIDAFLRREAK